MTAMYSIFLLLLGIGLGYVIRQLIAQKSANSVEAKIKAKVEKVKEEAKKIVLEAKEKATQIIEEAEEEERAQKEQLRKLEERLLEKEDLLDKRQMKIDEQEKENKKLLEKIQNIKAALEEAREESLKKLEAIAGLTPEEAKEEILKQAEQEYKEEIVKALRNFEQFRKEEIDKKAKEILIDALQKYSHSGFSEVTTTTISLPSEDIKGKIIGKEGRNIKHFEKLTGVDLILDDSSETIVLSSFDPVRRAVAALALEKLIKDGRIQPAKIEEKVAEAQAEIRNTIQKAGEDAVFEVGILDLPPELIHLLGRLNFRTSYGQNALAHSIEVALIGANLAAELGADVEIVKKAGLLHDIGKAISQEMEGSHLEIGRKILMKYNQPEEIIKAMQAHHEDYPAETLEAVIIKTADALSAARPGARKDNLEAYLKRLSNLEEIATAFEGVEKAYAISAGRELRVFVFNEKVDDLESIKLAKEIARQIEEKIKFPGEIKVTVIRETRIVEIAR
ncbi:MAG TPA: ribonuclease Y [Candidatus Paceibacterota bacterium]|mgnify:CR=1 FL=1|jgi:ribonuclease Y|nr:ribonuclease Y [Candidatus Paceibacterota bacterium]HOQ15210.1 ribonuclease Y [Candidatus Paceibacterota bacterium]HRR45791.1 ribonuclease Y [Candidatus Paceibacterota bacterium]